MFPEVFVPGYPRGLSFGARRQPECRREKRLGALLGQRHRYPGGGDRDLERAGEGIGRVSVIGVVERDREYSTGTLYNSIVYIGPDGPLLGTHRKLVLTGSERLLWGQGDGSTLTVIDTPVGRIGGLICWENYNDKKQEVVRTAGMS